MQNVGAIFYLIDRVGYLWDDNQFIVRRNSPFERIPRQEYRLVVCQDSYCWLDDMK
jgi:hypothetical protein